MSPIRVAIVEDEPKFAQAIATLLENTPGFQWVATYPTLADAVAKIPDARPHIALVDLKLPDGTGAECIRLLRGVARETKPIVLSKFDDPPRIFDAIVAGALGYVLKTEAGREILTAIEAVHAGDGAMSPAIARHAMDLLRREAGQRDITAKQQAVLKLVAQGMDNKQVGEALSISFRTVANHLTGIFKKLHITRRTQLPGYTKRSDRA